MARITGNVNVRWLNPHNKGGLVECILALGYLYQTKELRGAGRNHGARDISREPAQDETNGRGGGAGGERGYPDHQCR
eukprot:9366130-Heterocapsa_arctica.AAC.1